MSAHHDDAPRKLTGKETADLLARYRVETGAGFKLSSFDTDDLFPKDITKDQAAALLESGIKRLAALQEKLYARHTWSVLVVIQAMDAAGKDSTIKHVMSGVNPQGVAVTSFKAPGPEELAHDFLWKIVRALPARGMIGIFNRSHYEDVLVVRVHPEFLAGANLPEVLTDDPQFWHGRLKDITAFEKHLAREGTKIIKLFLNVSREEQKERLLARLDDPNKTWKFDANDLKERALWPAYRDAYQAAIEATAMPDAPWYIVPADRKWFTRLVVVEAIIDALSALDLTMPPLPSDYAAKLEIARTSLQDQTG